MNDERRAGGEVPPQPAAGASPPTRTLRGDRLLSVEQIVELLQVPRSWIYQRTSRKDLPFIKVGHYVRIWESDLQAYLDRQAVAAPQARESEFLRRRRAR